jgi:methoxymalonate biosynthesis protein
VIKCVVWDLDNTLLSGVYLEDEHPAADRRLAAVLGELEARGILQAVASKNPPEAATYAARLLGRAFAAVRCDWAAKSAAIRAIMADLGLEPAEVAFVDDDALERAEVSFALPDVLVLDPRDVADAASWPQFSPPVITQEARRRGELYAQRRARHEEARDFGGSVAEFLRQSRTAVRIAPAVSADLPRLHELSVRTHQFNSTGAEVSAADFAKLLSSSDVRVITVRLSDKFGDDGLVGACLLETGPGEPATARMPLVMMSCRALGRGVIDALLSWACQMARCAGAGRLAVPCVINSRNVPLRIALTSAGFRVGDDASGDTGRAATGDTGSTTMPRIADYVRQLDDPLPPLPDWVSG